MDVLSSGAADGSVDPDGLGSGDAELSPRRWTAPNWGVTAPSVTGAGATSTTSAISVAVSPLEEGEGDGLTVPASPTAACDRSTIASPADGHSGAGNGLPTSSTS
ncbi:hypothetical protein [Streptomyces sp. NPDC005012]|uniref:hypothetical protein n=1 Tax=Streptomyces sp. NPDC005012 TaxID=3154558 RepID=UPI0033BEBF18